MNITIPDTITIPLGRNAIAGTMKVDTTRFAPHVHLHNYEYGIRQLINDAMANKKDEDGNFLPADQIVAKAQKRLDTLYSGELRARGESGEPIDPVEAEAYKMAKSHLIKAFKPGRGDQALLGAVNTQRIAKMAEPFETLRDVIDAFLDHEKNAHIREAAARIVAEREAATRETLLETVGL